MHVLMNFHGKQIFMRFIELTKQLIVIQKTKILLFQLKW